MLDSGTLKVGCLPSRSHGRPERLTAVLAADIWISVLVVPRTCSSRLSAPGTGPDAIRCRQEPSARDHGGQAPVAGAPMTTLPPYCRMS
jgi:hypothetical protein